MLILDDEIRDYLRKRLRANITKPVLGGKSFFIKEGYNLYERDPYDKRLIKVIIIKLLGKKNNEACERYVKGKGAFLGYTFIKSWMDSCCFNYKKFDTCA